MNAEKCGNMNKSVVVYVDFVLSRWENFPPLSEGVRIGLVVVMSATLLVGSVGNILVLLMFSKYRSLRTTPNIFVVNLTIGDFLMCILCLPLLINSCLTEPHYDKLGYIICNTEAFLGAITGFISILSLTALAIDRCYVISRPIPAAFNDNKKCVYIGIVFIWVLAGGGASAPILGFGKYVQDGSRIVCSFDFFTRSTINIAYNITIQVVYFGLPVTAIVASYVTIFVTVRSHEKKYFRQKTGGTFDEIVLRRMRKNRKHQKNELKTARAGIILVVVFCLSWLPYSIVSVVALYGDNSFITPLTVSIPAVFAKLSTILNPILYALVHKRFKRKISLFLQRYFESVHTNTSNSSKNRHANGHSTHRVCNSIRGHVTTNREPILSPM